MSADNLELARVYTEAFNAGGIPATRHLRHPLYELHDPPDFPDAAVYVGEEEAMARVESYMAAGWDGRIRVDEYIEAGEEVIMVWRIAGTASFEMPLDQAFAHVLLFEEGKLRRVKQYMSKAECLSAIAAGEQPVSGQPRRALPRHGR